MDFAKKILIPLLDPAHAVSYLYLASALLPEDGKILLYRFLQKLRAHRHVRRLLTIQADPDRAKIEEAKWHDLVNLGHRKGQIPERLSWVQ